MSEQFVNLAQQGYAAFGRGDIPAVLELIAEDIDWKAEAQTSDVPWNIHAKNKEDMVRFFQALGDGLEFQTFNPYNFVHSGNQVVCQVEIVGKYRNSGKVLSTTEVHWWTFNEQNKLANFRVYQDTAAILGSYH